MNVIVRLNESKLIRVNNDTIREVVKREIKRLGLNADLNHIDVSEVTNMDSLFSKGLLTSDASEVFSLFNGDISLWNVENAWSMNWMFTNSYFNGDISGWNTKNVESMNCMFWDSKFNGDISLWNVNNLKNISWMLIKSPLNGKKPIWYQCLELKLFKNGEDYCYSLDWNWLRSNKTISRFRLEEAVENYGGEIKNIDQLKGYTFKD